MTRAIPTDLHEAFAHVLNQLRQTFGEDLIGVYALVQDSPHVIVAIEKSMTTDQRSSLYQAYKRVLHRDIGLTVFTKAQFAQGYPYESDLAYEPKANREIAEADFALTIESHDLALRNTARLRVLRQRGHVMAGASISQGVPMISNEDYRLVLRHEAEGRLAQLTTASTELIVHLCRILAFWRISLVIPTDDAGAWGLKNLDPRFQAIVERAATEHQSGSEPSAYNAYQLEQFAEYVRDMLRR